MTKRSIFVSYSHEDRAVTQRLCKYLRVTLQQREVSVFTDNDIPPGADWQDEIERRMADASVAILIISIDALTSGFMTHEEFPTLLRRRERDGLQVIPVIVMYCPWDRVPWLARLKVLPRDGEPLREGDEVKVSAKMTELAKQVAEILDPAPPDNAPSRREAYGPQGRLPAPMAAERELTELAFRQQSGGERGLKDRVRPSAGSRSTAAATPRQRIGGGRRWPSKP